METEHKALSDEIKKNHYLLQINNENKNNDDERNSKQKKKQLQSIQVTYTQDQSQAD